MISWLVVNRPSILVGAGIVGVGTLGVVSFRSGLRCAPILAKYRNDLSLTRAEQNIGFIKESLPQIIPPVLIGAADCGLILGAHNELVRKASVATALAATYETANADLRRQIHNELGETAATRIEDKVVKEQIKREGPPKSVQNTGHGDTLVRNMIGGRDFYACSAWLLKSIQIASEMCRSDGVISVNTVYNIIGIDGIDLGDIAGWYDYDLEDGLLPIKITSILDDGLEPILAISTYKVRSLEY